MILRSIYIHDDGSNQTIGGYNEPVKTETNTVEYDDSITYEAFYKVASNDHLTVNGANFGSKSSISNVGTGISKITLDARFIGSLLFADYCETGDWNVSVLDLDKYFTVKINGTNVSANDYGYFVLQTMLPNQITVGNETMSLALYLETADNAESLGIEALERDKYRSNSSIVTINIYQSGNNLALSQIVDSIKI